MIGTWGGVEVNWKAIVLIVFGFLGGVFSSISGSGIDICSFAALTLLFRVTEKTATPTSVVLMAINTVIGASFSELVLGGISQEAVKFFEVCVPVVTIGAPLGSLIGSHFHRLVLAGFVYVTDTVQLIGALVIVKPWSYSGLVDLPSHLFLTFIIIIFVEGPGGAAFLSILSGAIILFGGACFSALALTGARNMEEQEKEFEKEPSSTKRSDIGDDIEDQEEFDDESKLENYDQF